MRDFRRYWLALVMPPVAGTLQHIESGRVRALAITSKSRLALLPRISTVAGGGIPGFESGQWYGVFVPAATPQAIASKLHAEIVRTVRSLDMAEQIVQQGSIPLGDSPDQFGAYLRQEIDKWTKVVKVSGARLE